MENNNTWEKCGKAVKKIVWEKCEKNNKGKVWKISGKKCEKKFIEKMGEKWGNKVWGKCEKPKSGNNVKNSRGKFLEKNVEKNWRWKSVEKCQCGKKRDKFPWKNITYLVVLVTFHGPEYPKLVAV